MVVSQRRRTLVDDLAAQLCEAIERDFDFQVELEAGGEQARVLERRINDVLGAARRGLLDGAVSRREVDEGLRREVAGRKQTEEERRAKELAEAQSRAKSELLANVSHELRTPLTLILGPIDIILGGGTGEVPGPMRERLERVRRNAKRLAILIDDLLDFSKLEAGKWKVQRRSVPVVEVISQIVDDVRPVAELRGLALQMTIETDPGEVSLDRRMLDRIVLNLLGNAVKFTEPGGRVDLEIRDLGAEIEVVVADTGAGIPADKLPLLFQRFSQIDSFGPHKPQGTGLGLALVKELAELMGGCAGAESEPAKGSRFYVRLPRFW
jgi:signal transduction histidine kinase